MTTRALVRAGLAAILALVAAPACAGAHAIIRPAGDVITFTSPDATSTNTLTLRPTGSQIEFHDPTVDGGIDPGHCAPGELSSPGIFGEVVIQAFCPAAGVQAVRVDLGARDDTATVSLAIPVLISGGPASAWSRPIGRAIRAEPRPSRSGSCREAASRYRFVLSPVAAGHEGAHAVRATAAAMPASP